MGSGLTHYTLPITHYPLRITHYALPLQFRQRNPHLRLVFPLFVRITPLALIAFIGSEEEHLRDAFIGVNASGQGSRVRDLERHVTFPLRLERRDVGDDAAAGVGALADADGEHVARNAEVLDRARQGEGIG